jgi:hypothetical protein
MVVSPAADGSKLLLSARPDNHSPDAECAIITQPAAATFVLWSVGQILRAKRRIRLTAPSGSPASRLLQGAQKKAAAPEEAAAL